VLPTPTTTQTVVPGLTHQSSKGRKIGAVIGGIVCGIVVVVAALGLFLWRARVKRRRATRAAAAVMLANRALHLREKGAKTRDESHEVPLEAMAI
jgi:predicted membrane-bound spermidine synthase